MTNTTRNRAEPGRALARILTLGLGLVLAGGPARAVDLVLPSNARLTAERISGQDSHVLATGPVVDGQVPTITAEGQVARRAWRINAQGLTTLQLLAPLRAQLVNAGYETLYECAAAACGGFDFRFALEVMPAPDMHVDLFDFRYLAARRTDSDGRQSHVALLTSRTATAGFVQVVQIVPPDRAAPRSAEGDRPALGPADPAQTADPARPGTPLPLVAALERDGHAVLSDLTFETGSSTLGSGDFASLAALADYLLADPARRIALVGHTDAVGGLDGNIALSKRRATSVLERLATDFGVPRSQMAAEGMGYLAPLASNLAPEGREMNRRVEAVLLNTE
ncbi:OmpA family protein [Aquicoccus porphyridii]|uniref:OmpA family protein n=1 Tax=Aquicoccus porphyridii TaxID=1852029 RepID=UPI00273EBECD|nr:OmpA family protein [Aquicoccus porphyridii]